MIEGNVQHLTKLLDLRNKLISKGVEISKSSDDAMTKSTEQLVNLMKDE